MCMGHGGHIRDKVSKILKNLLTQKSIFYSSNLVSYFYHTAIKQMESEIEEKQRLNEGNNFKDFN